MKAIRVVNGPEPGSFVRRELEFAGASLLLVRGKDGSIRAMHNVCTHRGTQLTDEECSKRATFSCRYHMWTFGTDGALLSAPDFERFSTTKESCALRPNLVCSLQGQTRSGPLPSPSPTPAHARDRQPRRPIRPAFDGQIERVSRNQRVGVDAAVVVAALEALRVVVGIAERRRVRHRPDAARRADVLGMAQRPAFAPHGLSVPYLIAAHVFEHLLDFLLLALLAGGLYALTLVLLGPL